MGVLRGRGVPMGRTVPTYRLHTESILNDWMDYRRALRERDREVFDELMFKARAHASAGSYTAHLDPVATMFLSILLELQKEIQALRTSAPQRSSSSRSLSN